MKLLTRAVSFLLFFCPLAFATEATLVSDARLEMGKGKGSVGLKAGTVVEFVGKEGDSAVVVYRKIQGRIPLKSVNLPTETPDVAAAEKAAPPVEPVPKVEPAKPKEAAKPAAGGPNQPTTNYGKAVKKARDNEAKHKENVVDPANEVVAPKN